MSSFRYTARTVALLVCFSIASLAAIGKAFALDDEFEYDENGTASAPVVCPPGLPFDEWWSFFTITNPATIWVDKYNPLQGGVGSSAVPFKPISYSYITGSLGNAWYAPDQVESDRYDELLWEWTSANGVGPAVQCSCWEQRILFGLFRTKYVNSTPNVRGAAVVIEEEIGDSGDDAEITSSGDGQTCWVLIHWWFDSNDFYHEQVVYSWCEGDET